MKKIRLLIADDHTIFRSGLKLLLESEPDFDVVGEANDGQQVVNMTDSLRPDVVLMDIGMPGLNGLEATKRIKDAQPDMKILVLTMHRSDEYFFNMLEAGASGYILKGAATSELLGAIRSVAQGDVFLYPSMARRLVQEFLNQEDQWNVSPNLLSPRENEVLRLIVDGYSSKEIAEQLVLSPSTVYTHQNNIMTKLNLNSRHELIRYAREHGLIAHS
jgi:two-component system response regulator NreC